MTKLTHLLLAVLLLTGTAQAQTLLDIYELAKINDPAIREAEANMLAEMQAKPLARSRWLPQIDAGANYIYSESEGVFGAGTVIFDNDTTRETTGWNVGITQSLLNTETWRELKKSDKEVARAQVDYAVAQQELIIRVAEAYFDVLAAQDTLVSETAAKDAIGRQLEQANRRFEVGLIAITDVKESQAGYDDAVALEIAARRSLATAKEGLREITGEYPRTLASPGEDFPLIPPNPQVEQDWVDIAMQQNLAVESSKINTEITRDNVKIAEGGHWPTLGLSGQISSSDGDQTDNSSTAPPPPNDKTPIESDTRQISINFSLPIFSGGGVSAEVQREVYRHRAARESYEQTIRETERETRDAYLGVIAEIARVRALARAVESNTTALEATEAGYDVGTRTTVDVLNQRQSLFLSQTQYARSKYDYLINVLKLKRAAGTLSSDDVALVNGWLTSFDTLSGTPGRDEPDTNLPPTTLDQAKEQPPFETPDGNYVPPQDSDEPGIQVDQDKDQPQVTPGSRAE